MSSQKLIFLCVAEKSGESEVFVPSPALSPPLSPAAQFIVAVFDSCDHLRPREAGGEEARGGERELVRALGAGPTAGKCVWQCCLFSVCLNVSVLYILYAALHVNV